MSETNLSAQPLDAVPLDETQATGTLDYATLDADGLPSFIPEIEKAIDAGLPIRKIGKRFRKSFRRRADLNRYIVKSFRRRFDPAALSHACVECGEPTEGIGRVAWTFHGFESWVSFRISDGDRIVRVNTWHPLCEECITRWERSVRWPLRLRSVRGWLMIAFVAFYFLGQTLFRPYHSNAAAWMRYGYLSVIVVGFLVALLCDFWFYLCTPQGVNRLTPGWMKFRGFDEFTHRDELLTEAVAVEPAECRNV